MAHSPYYFLVKERLRVRIAIPIPPEDKYPNYFAALQALGSEGVKVDVAVDPMAFDGLLLPGGDDVDPANYGQGMNGAQTPDPPLDALQLTVIRRFYRAGKPIFGICRGHQLLNVFFGGTLVQHLPTHQTHDWDEGSRTDKAHAVTCVGESWLEGLYGHRFVVNSAHHQAVDAPGAGIVIDLRADDGVVEAAHCECAPVWSVQFHPERMAFAHRRPDTVDGAAVLQWFLARCAEYYR